jgi:hypothetical protein
MRLVLIAFTVLLVTLPASAQSKADTETSDRHSLAFTDKGVGGLLAFLWQREKPRKPSLLEEAEREQADERNRQFEQCYLPCNNRCARQFDCGEYGDNREPDCMGQFNQCIRACRNGCMPPRR